jgi:hypothetical protein
VLAPQRFQRIYDRLAISSDPVLEPDHHRFHSLWDRPLDRGNPCLNRLAISSGPFDRGNPIPMLKPQRFQPVRQSRDVRGDAIDSGDHRLQRGCHLLSCRDSQLKIVDF